MSWGLGSKTGGQYTSFLTSKFWIGDRSLSGYKRHFKSKIISSKGRSYSYVLSRTLPAECWRFRRLWNA